MQTKTRDSGIMFFSKISLKFSYLDTGTLFQESILIPSVKHRSAKSWFGDLFFFTRTPNVKPSVKMLELEPTT